MSQIVQGFHGTSREVAELILNNGAQYFQLSQNEYDWLGDGVYFWENNLTRAMTWAKQHFQDEAAVLEATISLADCMDLTDDYWKQRLAEAYVSLKVVYRRLKKRLPKQTALRHDRDKVVIEHLIEQLWMNGKSIRCVRGSFDEGRRIFPLSAIRRQSHIQIAVRDTSLITNLRIHTA